MLGRLAEKAIVIINIANIAKTNPKNIEELSQLKGMGKRKIRDYGEELLLILENFYDMKS